MEAETVAFGYPARAFVFEQRVRNRTFGYPRQAPSLTASDGLALLNRAWDFPSDLFRVAEIFFETGEPPKAVHLFAYFETPERTPLRVKSLNGTFETCPPILRMSVHRGRPEVAVVRSTDANDP
jgi:hypothetical protein